MTCPAPSGRRPSSSSIATVSLSTARHLGSGPCSTWRRDSVLGVQAGVAAGMRVLGFAEGARAVVLAAADAPVFGAMRGLPALVLRV